MKMMLLILFILSLASALFLDFDYFSTENLNSVAQNSFAKNSLEEKVYSDFFDLKNRKQLPDEIFDSSGIFVSDQRADQSEKLSREIVTALRSVVHLRSDGLYELELIVFDTTQLRNPKDKKNRPGDNPKATKNNELIFQFSIVEKKTKNKVAEFGRTYVTK